MKYVLHIPSWFPNGKDPYSGNFIERHIAAISMFYPCVTLQVAGYNGKPKGRTVETNGNNTVVTYYLPEPDTVLSKIISKIKRYYYYKKGAAFIRKHYGIPQVIHLHVAMPMGGFAAKLSKKWGIPLLLSEHWSIYQPRNRGRLSAANHAKLKSIFDTVDRITTVSRDLQEKIDEMFPGKLYAVIPNVVDVTKFRLEEAPEERKKTIMHISDLDDQVKNFSGILRAIKQVSLKRTDFVLKVIHDNRNTQAEEFVKENKMDDFVQFLGAKTEDEVAIELRHSDFLLLFSNYENQPCVIIEAFACGKPVIATAVGGIPEIVDKSYGRLVSPEDEARLTDEIGDMLDRLGDYDPVEIRKYACTHFSGEVVGKAFFDVYKRLGLQDQ